ncbi:MAG: T9SS type A sorting domain-containing protein [Bacteroidales bacterium]|nr:T9SS type A sorting domain-containing protein [Bacteroidales bacterium]
MKRILYIALLPLLLCGIMPVWAQSGCSLHINTDFDSECLLTEYFRGYPNLLETDSVECLLACKGGSVTYTAVCPDGVQYTWTVTGASGWHTAGQGQSVVVTWGSGDAGGISVNVVTSGNNTCTADACVLLMDTPQVASATVPAYYTDMSETKTIEVCLNAVIDLMDMSTAGQTPITGCLWTTPFGNASTPNHTITATQAGTFTIGHYVQNECGCESYEEITLHVTEPLNLELSCYGTVCAGSSHDYTLLDPYCTPYRWNVEGGSYIQDPADPSTIHVQWGNPPSGYGVISIDAAFCESYCDALASIRIPVIADSVDITGPDVVCVGDVQQYGLPLWGSTQYLWGVSPSGSAAITGTEGPNSVLVHFGQAGTYTLEVAYACDFIGCGPFGSSKTIVVKDTMSVNSGDHTLCAGATGHYGTWHGNVVAWEVYSEDNLLLHSSNGVSLDYTFAYPGNYRVVASGSSYCREAECWVTVLAGPPALTATSGPHEACAGSSILLGGTPTHPGYYLEWVPVCTTALPQSVDGNEVTINYGNDVCDVAVFQVDGENGCRSAAYIHEVDLFVLAASGLPSSVELCAGTPFTHTVPLQDNVLYEWTVSPAGVAVVQGEHLSNQIYILTNHLTNNQPATALVTLKRTCCSGQVYAESFVLTTMDAPAPTISYSTPICQGGSASFAVTSTVTDPSDYTWHIGGGDIVGSSTSHVYAQSGLQPFTLSYQPYPACQPVVVHGTVEVVAPPVAIPYFDGQDVRVVAYPNATYSWSKDGVAQPQVQGSVFPNAVTGTYCCTVTYTTTPYCSATGCVTVTGGSPPSSCITMPCTATATCGTADVTLTNTAGGTVSWSVSPQLPGTAFTYQDDYSATLSFSLPGVYTISAGTTVGGQCYYGESQVAVECVPDFSLVYMCGNPVGFVDGTLCLDGVSVTSRKIEVTETGYVDNSFNGVSIPHAAFQQGTTNHVIYTVTLSNGHQCQVVRTLTIDYLPQITSLNIASQLCEKTPYQFFATATGSDYLWNFGDGTYQHGNGIYHAFNSSSTVSLTVHNADGCVAFSSASVTVVDNSLTPGLLLPVLPDKVCPGTIREISFLPNSSNNLYFWEHSQTGVSSNTYDTYQTGDYYVLVTDNNGCKAERILNVGFKNAPTARITGSTEYCLGGEVSLNGNTGASNQYAWNVTGPANYSFTTPNVKFTPTLPGTYYVSLTVTSQEGCTATATTTITVHAQPPAPSIAFYNNECIHTPPVNVHSTTGQSLLWNNGYHGVSADYYVPGFLTAHYIDPSTGCPSAKSTLFIPPAPNYDALLTGCYEICGEDLPAFLHVYGLYPYNVDGLEWFWYEDDQLAGQGNTMDAVLPVNIFGEYFMDTHYGNGCMAKSPNLDIAEADVCPCDSLTVSVNKKCSIDSCTLSYGMSITVHNNGSQSVVFDQLSNHTVSNILYVDALPFVVPAHRSNNIDVTLEFLDFSNPFIEFVLFDNDNNCELVFSEHFDWEDCHIDECYAEHDTVTFQEVLSTPHQTSYFNVHLELPVNTADLEAVWSDFPQMLSYNYLPYTDVDALLMLSYGRLTQMAMADEKICVHAIVCLDGNKLCHLQVCFDAFDLWGLVPDDHRQLADSSTADNDTTRSLQAAVPQVETLWLAPNPAHDEVTVMGVDPGEVVEITVLTMEGRQVAVYRNDHRFNVSRLAKANYIVRVVTTGKRVHYLKMVKQ